jgi:hypothetical protein
MAPPEVRDTKEMLAVAEKAVAMDPHTPLWGAALCRVGRFKEAVAILEKNTKRSADTDLAFALYFLSMSWQGLKDPAKARLSYDWAERWTGLELILDPVQRTGLQQLHTEVASTLGIEESAGKDRPTLP